MALAAQSPLDRLGAEKAELPRRVYYLILSLRTLGKSQKEPQIIGYAWLHQYIIGGSS